MSRRKLNDRLIYVRSRARELARSGRFERWQGIEFELRFIEGLPEACTLLASGPVRQELNVLCQEAGSSARMKTSTKSKTQETLKTLEELIAEYSAFQRSRPDLPQGSLCDLSQDELELLVVSFQLHKAEQEVAEQTERINASSLTGIRAPSCGYRSITGTAVHTALAPNRFKDFWRD